MLSRHVESVAVKRLRRVEIDSRNSNQHELNGTRELQRVLGRPENGEQWKFPTTFIWLSEDEDATVAHGDVTFYDARYNNPDRAPEYRVYYPTTVVTELADEGDTLFVARRPDDSLMMIVAAANSTADRQLHWLFGLEDNTSERFYAHEIDESVQVDFAARLVLEQLGIPVVEPEVDTLDNLVSSFDGMMPKVAELSAFARSSLPELDPRDDPDNTLMAWIERDEQLFRRLERNRIEERLSLGFGPPGETDVEGFVKYSLSVQNSRKSRAGHSFENHLKALFDAFDMQYVRGAITENRSRPDFLFPGIDEYNDPEYPVENLIMLGAKTTCKDRWRQVLSEAKRLTRKHLTTLQPAISENQTNEMSENNLQLVIPSPLHRTYTAEQADWLMSMDDFLRLAIDTATPVSRK